MNHYYAIALVLGAFALGAIVSALIVIWSSDTEEWDHELDHVPFDLT